jgi:hypothetical protein
MTLRCDCQYLQVSKWEQLCQTVCAQGDGRLARRETRLAQPYAMAAAPAPCRPASGHSGTKPSRKLRLHPRQQTTSPTPFHPTTATAQIQRAWAVSIEVLTFFSLFSLHSRRILLLAPPLIGRQHFTRRQNVGRTVHAARPEHRNGHCVRINRRHYDVTILTAPARSSPASSPSPLTSPRANCAS